MAQDPRLQRVASHIRDMPDFPIKGILFRDIFPMMRHPDVMADCIDVMVEHVTASHPHVDAIVGLDARGFIFGSLMAAKLKCAFVPIRKAGKLPGETVQATYKMHYGEDVFEAQKDGVKVGEKVVIVDDVLATGGTICAAMELMQKLQVEVLECMFLIELTDLDGRIKVPGKIKTFLSLAD